MDNTLNKPADNTGSEGEELTPQEETLVTEALNIALNVIHGEGKTGDDIAKLVLESPDVSEGIGMAISTVLLITEKQIQIPEELLMVLGTQILVEIADLAIEAGAMAEDELNEQFVDRVVSKAYTSYLTAKESMGELDPQHLKQSVSEAETMGESMGMNTRNPKQAPQQQQAPNQAQGLLSRIGGA